MFVVFRSTDNEDGQIVSSCKCMECDTFMTFVNNLSPDHCIKCDSRIPDASMLLSEEYGRELRIMFNVGIKAFDSAVLSAYNDEIQRERAMDQLSDTCFADFMTRRSMY